MYSSFPNWVPQIAQPGEEHIFDSQKTSTSALKFWVIHGPLTVRTPRSVLASVPRPCRAARAVRRSTRRAAPRRRPEALGAQPLLPHPRGAHGVPARRDGDGSWKRSGRPVKCLADAWKNGMFHPLYICGVLDMSGQITVIALSTKNHSPMGCSSGCSMFWHMMLGPWRPPIY